MEDYSELGKRGIQIARRVAVYGDIKIGNNTRILENVILGFPTQKKILGLNNIFDLQQASQGCIIGAGCLIRPGVIIYESTVLGDNILTGHNVLIRESTVIGNGTRIGTNTVIDGNVKIGENCNIQTGVYIPPGTVIGNNVFLGPGVTITNDRYPPSPKVSGVTIGDDCIIGANSILIAGIHIENGCIVGAGSIVTKDIPCNSMVLGRPAKVVSSRSEYLLKQDAFIQKEAI